METKQIIEIIAAATDARGYNLNRKDRVGVNFVFPDYKGFVHIPARSGDDHFLSETEDCLSSPFTSGVSFHK